MPQKIGLYGGSFNPVHHGHLIVARSVAETLGLDRIVFLPSATPPHKESGGLLDAGHRAEMVRLAIAGEPGFEYSEYDLTRAGPSYTFDTVTHFTGTLSPGDEVCWIIGADSLMELGTWYRVADLVDACRIVTAARPGWDRPDLAPLAAKLGPARIARLRDGILETPRIDISATDIRDRVAAGRSIRFLVPESVRLYIEMFGLYR